jgi:hypothetical protein
MICRIVVETNVLVSAVLNQRCSPALILDAVLDGEVFSSNIAVWSLKKVFDKIAPIDGVLLSNTHKIRRPC